MRVKLIWAYFKWCLTNIFGGLIEHHYKFIKTMRRDPALAILASILFGLLFTGATIIIALVVGPTDLQAARQFSATCGYIAALSSVGYVTMIAVIASWKAFAASRQELFEILKDQK